MRTATRWAQCVRWATRPILGSSLTLGFGFGCGFASLSTPGASAGATDDDDDGEADGADADADDAADSDGSTTAGADYSGDGPVAAPGPWDHGWAIPAEPQTDGDPEAGYRVITEGTILTCGVPTIFWGLVRPFLASMGEGEPLSGRTGDNAAMPYDWTVHTPPSGVRMASQNCLGCHAGYVNGELVVGVGAAHKDFTMNIVDLLDAVPILDLPPGGDLSELLRFFDRVDGMGRNTVMRTIGTNPAEMVAISLVAHRDRDTLEWNDEPHYEIPPVPVPSDPPPWWRSRKKNALFYNAMARGDHRGTMMLATSLCTDTVEEAIGVASQFNNVHAFVRSVQAPVFPFAVDQALATHGKGIFEADCAGCHGTYGASEADDTYPNLLLPLDVIGTDPVVAEGGTLWAPYLVEWYNDSYYGTITRMVADEPWPGYAAPPLDGIWATAPFLHNGSVPNLALVLDSTRRPTYWRRIDYDSKNFDTGSVGWPYVSEAQGHEGMEPAQAKYVFDTTQFGHGNEGHTFGDHLTDDERASVIEYLKTL